MAAGVSLVHWRVSRPEGPRGVGIRYVSQQDINCGNVKVCLCLCLCPRQAHSSALPFMIVGHEENI